MKIVGHRVVGKTLYSFLHLHILVNDDLEAASHLLVIDLVFLPRQLFLIQLDNIRKSSRHIKVKSLVYPLLDHFHFLHHEGFLPLPALHILNPLCLDSILDLLLGGLVYIVQNLELGPRRIFRLPLVEVHRIESLLIIDKISQIVPLHRYIVQVCHIDNNFFLSPIQSNQNNKNKSIRNNLFLHQQTSLNS